jgi:formate dehydrogenase
MDDRGARSSTIPIVEAGRGRQKVRATPKGRPTDPKALAEVRALLGERPRRRDLLIEHLHLLQDAHGHISAAHVVALAAEMKLAMTEVYEVATFYHHFDVVKEGEAAPPPLTVRICDSFSCEMAGAKALAQALEGQPGVRIANVPCVGRCHAAPVAVVGQNPVDAATPARVKETIAARATAPEPVHHVGYAQYRAEGGYALLRDLAEGRRDAESVFATMEQSGLRGLGGAGFPAGRKWRIVRAEPAPRLMAVNIDEGEPGTFKDRWYLERDPHRFLEGMLIAARLVDIAAVYIYLRDEYAGCRATLQRELDALLADPPCPLPPIELRRGAGAYICGEESAMLESIEGKRGLPRHKPPFPSQVGLFGRPTLINNVETLYWVRDILEKGAAWYTGHGRRERKGLRTFSVSGRVKEPGVKLAPAGITVRELIDEFCGGMAEGHTFKGYLPGGASGGILPASMGDEPLDFGTLEKHGSFVGSHAVVILSDQDDMKAVALNLLRFFEDESCGQCTPCRAGTEKAVKIMSQPRWDEALLEDLKQVMGDASICGLGQAAMNPVRSVMTYFRDDLEPSPLAGEGRVGGTRP